MIFAFTKNVFFSCESLPISNSASPKWNFSFLFFFSFYFLHVINFFTRIPVFMNFRKKPEIPEFPEIFLQNF